MWNFSGTWRCNPWVGFATPRGPSPFPSSSAHTKTWLSPWSRQNRRVPHVVSVSHTQKHTMSSAALDEHVMLLFAACVFGWYVRLVIISWCFCNVLTVFWYVIQHLFWYVIQHLTILDVLKASEICMSRNNTGQHYKLIVMLFTSGSSAHSHCVQRSIEYFRYSLWCAGSFRASLHNSVLEW